MGRWRRVVVQKVDLDTALTALLMGVSGDEEVRAVPERAGSEDLEDPRVLCIEAGGSGQVHLNNYDHHDTPEPLPPACVQAFRAVGEPARFARLVEYVSAVDEGRRVPSDRPAGSVGLSGLFSGMLLRTPDPAEQLRQGVNLLRAVLDLGLDPFGPMPERPEWADYLQARRENERALEEALRKVQPFRTRGGLPGAFLETSAFAAYGVLYRQGYRVVVLYNPRFGHPPRPKYTIGGNGLRVDGLLPFLNSLEPGWGGPAHGTVIGSPRRGSRLSPEEVLGVVEAHL